MGTQTLIINSYAGSLVLGAERARVSATRSLEDSGYGADIQAENFPDLKIVPKRDSWQDSWPTGRVVIAHPPCAAFSIANPGKSRKVRGTKADKFQCTVDVINYALGNRAIALMIESVVPAMIGAAEIHEALADRYGYMLIRVLQNAASFGVPQWRPRFWAVFLDKAKFPKRVPIGLNHKFKTLGKMADETLPIGSASERDRRDKAKQTDLLKRGGFSAEDITRIYSGEETGRIARVMMRMFPERLATMEQRDVEKAYCRYGSFSSNTMRILDPEGFAPVLLFNSFWLMMGRLLTVGEHKAIMGYPRGYKMPPKRYMEFLSRGVCPPVAEWLLRWVHSLLDGSYDGARFWFERIVMHGEIADFTPPSRTLAELTARGDGRLISGSLFD